MRWQDMRAGEAYALRGHRDTKVTLLETPPELRRQARVRVRFESGVKAGEVGELLSRRIAAPWEGAPEPKPPRSQRRFTRVTVVERAPEIGDLVTWRATAGLVWKLVEVDRDANLATIVGSIFEQPATRVLPVNHLQVHVDEPVPSELARTSLTDVSDSTPTLPLRRDSRFQTTEHLRPTRPRRALDEMLDDVLFSPGCLESYKQRYARKVSGPAVNEQLRDDILRDGYIMDGGLPGADEYARLRVPRRFDVVLKSRPTAERPVTVRRLHFVADAKARRRRRHGRGKQDRRAA